MTIAAASQQKPLPFLDQGQAIVDPKTGLPTNYFMQLMQAWRGNANGCARIVPCNASGTNLITLTPTHPVAPVLDRYRDFDVYAFVAAATSTGSVTATVVPASGTLATLKAYKSGGAAQAGSGDVVKDSLYLAIFNDALDSGNGGLVLK